MRRLFTILLAIALAGTTLVAQQSARDAAVQQAKSQTWTGTLADAACKAADAAKPCEVSTSTDSFMLVTSSGSFKLDATGNTIVADELRKHGKKGAVNAEVKGTLEKDTIRLESVALKP